MAAGLAHLAGGVGMGMTVCMVMMVVPMIVMAVVCFRMAMSVGMRRMAVRMRV